MPGEELQRHHTMVGKMEKVNSINDLSWRHVQVDYTEIIFQAMSDEDYSAVWIKRKRREKSARYRLDGDVGAIRSSVIKLTLATSEALLTYRRDISTFDKSASASLIACCSDWRPSRPA